MTAYKRPLIETDKTSYPNELILKQNRTEPFSIVNTVVTLQRVCRLQYGHDVVFE